MLRLACISFVGLLALFAHASERLIVGCQPGFTAAVSGECRLIGLRQADAIPQLHALVFFLPDVPFRAHAAEVVQGLTGVRYVQYDGLVHAQFVPNDPLYPNQWNLRKIDMERAWDISLGSAGTTIAIVDTGIASNHVDLAAKLAGPGRDFVNNDFDANDDNGHGTHVAGTAGALTNNSIGIASVAANAKLLGVKVLNSGGSGTFAQVAQGIVWAADQSQLNVKVINLSLGSASPSQVMEDAVNYAMSKECVIVASAGASNSSNPMYPAAYPGVLSVGGTSQSDAKTPPSSFGNWVLVGAPGENIISTYLNNTYTTFSGTSMAASHVAGEAGLLYGALGNSVEREYVQNRILYSTDPMPTQWFRFGRINVRTALGVVLARSEQIVFGTGIGGILASTYGSDDDRRVIENGMPFLITQSPITVEYSGLTAVKAPTSLKYWFEGHATAQNLVLRTDLWEFAQNRWVQIDERPAAVSSDSSFEVVRGDPDRFVAPSTGEVRWRLRLKDDAPSLLARWQLRVDRSAGLAEL